jgi:Lhr-like helicase
MERGGVQMSEDEKVAERVQRSFFSTDRLSKMIIAFDSGDMVELIRLYDEALERRFEDGIQYAKDSVGEWNGK